MRSNWNDRYPPYPQRPRFEDWPAWYRISPEDLASFLPQSGIPLRSIRSILDLGAGDGRRIIHAMARNPEMNRPDLHVTCVDFATRAICWGVDLWSRLREGLVVSDYEIPFGIKPKWSMSYRDEDAMSLPQDICRTQFDVIIDWLMFHGMPLDQVPHYVASINRMAPTFFVLKCFSTEGSTLTTLQQAVTDVDKHQWSRAALEDLFGDHYEVIGKPVPCEERLDLNDGDGPRAAKMEYCFKRK